MITPTSLARPLSGLLLLTCLGGCSGVTVKQAAPGTAVTGYRYSLPQPFLVVTPLTSGGVSTRWEFLPDPDESYAIDTWAFLAKQDASIKIVNGQLVYASTDADSSSLAVSLAEAAESGLAERNAAATAAAKALAEQEKAKRDALQANLEAALIEQIQATATYEAVAAANIPKNDPAYVAALAALNTANAKVKFYNQALAGIPQESTTPDGKGAFDAGPPLRKLTTRKVPGEVWYQLTVDTSDPNLKHHERSLRLVPVTWSGSDSKAQRDFETYSIPPKKDATSKPTPSDSKDTVKSTSATILEYRTGVDLSLPFVVESGTKYVEVELYNLDSPSGSGLVSPNSYDLRPKGPATCSITFKPELEVTEKGYELIFEASRDSDKTLKRVTFRLGVKP